MTTEVEVEETHRIRRLDRVVDIALVLVAIIAGALRDLTRVEPIRDPAVAAAREGLVSLPIGAMLALQVVGGLILLGRRRRPYLVGLVLAGLALVHPTFAGLLAPYSVARYGARLPVTAAVNLALWLGALAGARLLELLGSTRFGEGDPYTIGLVCLALTGFGLYLRTRSALVTELLARVQESEAARTREAAAARLEERLSLAGELHDMVSHWVTLMVLQAGALTVRAEDARVREEAEAIRRSGARALDELHDLVRVLAREEAGTPEPETTVQELAADFDPGGGVAVHVDGHPGSVTPAGDRTVRRIVRESLVNARKHAPGTDVDVDLRYDAHGVRVAVTNGTRGARSTGSSERPAAADTPAPTSADGSLGPGMGLAALRRRCHLLGGTFEAGPIPDGGFRVEAYVPSRPPTEGGGLR